MTNQDFAEKDMTVMEINESLERDGISAKKFWQIAMGGDMAPLPASVVQSIINDHEREIYD